MNAVDRLNLTLTNPVLPDAATTMSDASQEKKVQFAKDFESVFIEKLLDEMKNTIGDWGLEQDDASRQVQGLFWMHLARDVSNNGGLGMWKEIYQSLGDAENKTDSDNSLDREL
jgi:flagellar protein FlgJ